jgi:nicotinate-nucleotide adenylyltransferase
MNIAILGGSFDPPHKGHVTIAKRLMKLHRFDQIWLMSCYQHPFNKNLSAPEKRLEMTSYLANCKIKVSDLEINQKNISYSIDTLRFLAKKFPQDNFSWVIGTDQVKDLPKWKEWKEIVNNFKLIVVPRAGFKKAEKDLQALRKLVSFPKNIILIDRKTFPPVYISSTLTRQRIKKNKSISNMVPKKIEKYLTEHNLYK